MTDSSDTSDSSFPLLSEIVTRGNPSRARQAQGPWPSSQTGHQPEHQAAPSADPLAQHRARGADVPGAQADDATRPGRRHHDDFDLPTLTDRLEHAPAEDAPAAAPANQIADEIPDEVTGEVPEEVTSEAPHESVAEPPVAHDEADLPMLSDIVDASMPLHPGVEAHAAVGHEASPPRELQHAQHYAPHLAPHRDDVEPETPVRPQYHDEPLSQDTGHEDSRVQESQTLEALHDMTSPVGELHLDRLFADSSLTDPSPGEAPHADRPHRDAPAEAGSAPAADTSVPSHALDADLIAERLRGRFASFLAGEGREVIEARCRQALSEHGGWLVSQITREVALELETQLTDWVREAVDEELAQRSNHATRG